MNKRGTSALVWVSIAFIFASILNFFVFGAVGQDGITGARYADMNERAQPSLAGAIVLLLGGGPVLLATTIVDSFNLNRRVKTTHIAICIVGFALFFASGGRNSFLIGIVYLWAYTRVVSGTFPSNTNTNKISLYFINRLKIFIIWLAVGIGVLFSLYIFIERGLLRGVSLIDRLILFSGEYDLNIWLVDGLPPVLEPVYFVAVYLFFYFTHSFSYISAYFEADYMPSLFGGYTFYTPLRSLDALIGTGLVDGVLENLLVSGVYLSLPGSLYVDFGLFGVFVFAFLMAAISLYAVNLAVNGFRNVRFFAAFLITVGIMAPLYSIFSIGNGPSLLVLSVFAAVVPRFRAR